MSEGPTSEVSAARARALLLDGLGLLPGAGTAAKAPVQRSTLDMIESIGFVQVDSINVVERAHHHIAWVRTPGYEPRVLESLLVKGLVFEQWTHDASVIPAKWFPHWRHRFTKRGMGTWIKQRLGKDADRVVEKVRRRIEAEGPLMAKDFVEARGGSGGWWEWTPSKAALEHLWRVGELSICARVNFHKVYDLTSRALPKVYGLAMPSEEEHVEWACRTALERLGVATAREVAQFWNAIDQKRVQRWCEGGVRAGEVERVSIEAADGSKPRPGFALAGWKERASAALARLDMRPSRERPLRLLSPFDPLVRDRARCKRLFNFEYNFEAFVPEKKRKYGYYVLPILDGDRLVGRLDPKADREAGRLIVKGVWWEKGVRETTALRKKLDEALEEYAGLNGVGWKETSKQTARRGARIDTR
jgi:uncharacterized protein